MATSTPRLTLASSPRNLPQMNLAGSGTAHDSLYVSTPRHTELRPRKKTQPDQQRRKATTLRLTDHLARAQQQRRSRQTSPRPLTVVPPLNLSPVLDQPGAHAPHSSQAESSQAQFQSEDSNRATDANEASSRSERGAPPSLVRSGQHSLDSFRPTTAVPIGSTAAELKNVVHHRQAYTDKKKRIGLAGWGAGLTVEGLVALASTATVPLTGVAAVAAWSGVAAVGTWIGGIYDRYEAHGSRQLSKKDYENALKLRSNAILDRLTFATALADAGLLEQGQAYLDAAREMVVMLDEVLMGNEGYLAPAEAELLAKRRELELSANDELIEQKRNPAHDMTQYQRLNDRMTLMPDGKSARGKALNQLKAQLPDLTGPERDEVQHDIDRLELIAKQKKYPRLLRNPKHLGHKRVKLDRDRLLVDIRLPPDIAATLITFIGVGLGITAMGFVAPAATIVMSPFWMRSARMDLEDAFRERLTADASLKAILNKLALGRAMVAHFDAQPDSEQTRFGKCIARNLQSAALREYKQAMRLQNLSEKKETKGAGLRYVAIPSLVVLAGSAIVASVLGVATGGIAFGVAAALTGIGVGAYYIYLSRLKKKAKTEKHEAQRRQAAALWVKDQVGDVRMLFTSDRAAVKGIVTKLWIEAPYALRPYITVDALLNDNEHLLGMALSEEYTNSPTGAAVTDSEPFAVQMSKPLGLSDKRSNFLLHDGPLLKDAGQQGKVALATLVPLFAGAKVYDTDRLPAYQPQKATDKQLKHAVDVLNRLAASPEHEPLVQLIAREGRTLEAIKQRARQNPGLARSMREAAADLRTALIDLNVPLAHLAELQDLLVQEQESLPPLSQLLLSVSLEWTDVGLKGTHDGEAFTRPPLGTPQFEQAIQQLGLAQKTERQQKRIKEGQSLFTGGGIRTPKQWLEHFDKKPLEKDMQIGNLVSMWRDALPRDAQGRIDVPDGYADENDYLLHLMQETVAQYASMRDSVAEHAGHDKSRMFDALLARFGSSMELAADCARHLAGKRFSAMPT